MEKKFNIHEIKAIIGLGNPGPKHVKNRHNIGFRIVGLLASESTWTATPIMLHTIIARTSAQYPGKIILIKPQTFMNNSGQVLTFLQKKGIRPEEILVAHDELEKTFGFTGITFSGSAKGHNGLRSIQSFIGADFWHLKFGIGRPQNKEDVPAYVLSNFNQQEEAKIDELITGCIEKWF